MASDVGYKQRNSIKGIEHDKHAQLRLVWIEATGCPYPDMRKRAYENDGP